ncbi:hypothetical protein AAMO2058_000285100 [Amorphochlora amoebiformis]
MDRLHRLVRHLSPPGVPLGKIRVLRRNVKKTNDVKLVQLRREGRVGVLTLNRPNALNALSDALIEALVEGISNLEADTSISVIVITGSGKAFAAGADIREMKDKDFHKAFRDDHIKAWEAVASCKLPIIAAVNGYALGGGCEIAMMCDIVYASEKAKFGQPEITLGTIPGAGGTQRLTRIVGKSKAMEMILSGGMIRAHEAFKLGLVSKVTKAEDLMPQALKLAKKIGEMSRPVLMIAKQAILSSFNNTLDQGVKAERHFFASTFALKDRAEGMKAFVQKRKPIFAHE